MKKAVVFFLFSILILSCSTSEELLEEPKSPEVNQVVVISVNAPDKQYKHYLQNDTLGKQNANGGIYQAMFNRFTYLDENGTMQEWLPEPSISDTLVIDYSSKYFELATVHPFTAIKHTFLLQKGDTAYLDYENRIPVARISNRVVNDTLLNYNKYRLATLYNNTYPSHWLVFGKMLLNPTFDMKAENRQFVENYMQAKKDYERESLWLKALTTGQGEYNYRMQALEVLMEKHRQKPAIAAWEKANQLIQSKETADIPRFDLSQADSLLRYSFFRDHLKYLARYDIDVITKTHIGSGSMSIDARARFDSIAVDPRFSPMAKDYLLTCVYEDILANFSSAEKKKYFSKLELLANNQLAVQQLRQKYNLDFNLSNQLLLERNNAIQTNYMEMLQANKGKWIYVSFWATWCKPCIENKPNEIALEKALKDSPITFVHIALNDVKDAWKRSTTPIQITRHDYFAVNGNSSDVIDELKVNSIPHYLIYNPEGKRVVDFAKRPGRGAKEQLERLMAK